MSMDTYGIIGFTPDNVGIDKRIFINSSGYSADSTFNVSYNAGRVDVYLNGIKLVGKQNSSQSYWDFTYTTEGQGNSITLATGTALTSSDVLEVIGFVSNSGNTVTTYNFTLSGSQQAFTANHVASDLVNVFLNGVRLDAADFTLNGSDTVTLGSTAVNGDVVHIQVIGALDNSNFVPAGGGTFSGNIGIGTNSPQSHLQVNGTGSGGAGEVSITRVDTSQTLVNGSGLGYLNFGGEDTNSGLDKDACQIVASCDEAWSDSAHGSRFEFFTTASNATSATERMRIKSDGDVEVKTGNLVIGTAGKGITVPTTSHTFTVKGINEAIGDSQEGTAPDTTDSNSGQFAIYNGSTKLFGITEHGYVVKPNVPSFLIQEFDSVSAGNILYGGATVKHNNGNHFNTSNGKFTAPISGFYWLAGAVLTNGANARVETSILINNVIYIHGNESTGTSPYGGAHCSGVAQLSAGDYVEFKLVSGAMYNNHQNNYFSAHLLS